MNVTICGAGNAAQTLIGLLGSHGYDRLTVFAPFADEAQRLRAACMDKGLTVAFAAGDVLTGAPQVITAEPQVAAEDADLVLLALPAFAHEPILRTLAPYFKEEVWIGALPARGGFDWMARYAVALPGRVVIFGLQTLPWACRIQDWGRRVEVLGTKAEVDMAVWPTPHAPELVGQMQRVIGVPLRAVSSFLALTLANTGQIIHPGIMYGLFHDWNGTPFAPEATPYFYGGVDDFTADVLQALSDEVQLLCRVLEQVDPDLDLGSVEPLHAWLLRAYSTQIVDSTTLRAAFNTNRAYDGLRAPVHRLEDGRCVPAFDSRYLGEDVPFGLLVTRGIAELADVATPTMSAVIEWAQVQLGRRYLVEGRVGGPDLSESRTPQRFGIVSTRQFGDRVPLRREKR